MEKISMEYGDGLFELACDEGCTDELLKEARALRSLLRDEPSYTRLMTSTTVSKEEKDALILQAFGGKVHPYICSFLRMMSDRGYFAYVPSCFSRFEDRYYLKNDLKKITVRTALPLDEGQKIKIRESVEKKLGVKAEAVYVVDPSLIAGLRIEADGVLIENSAKSRLEDLKRHLGGAVTDNN